MVKWLKKHYAAVSGLFLLAVLLAWTGVWDNIGGTSADIYEAEDTSGLQTSGEADSETDISWKLASGDDVSDSGIPGTDTDENSVDIWIDYDEAADGSGSDTDSNAAGSGSNTDSDAAGGDAESVASGDAAVEGTDSGNLGGSTETESESDADSDAAGGVTDNSAANTETGSESASGSDAGGETETGSETDAAEEHFSFEYCVANVNYSLNIRSGPDESYAIIAHMNPNAYAQILERGEEWTKIKSGSVTGYANNAYLLFDDEAVARLNRLNALYVIITANKVNIRSGPDTTYTVLKSTSLNQKFLYLPQQDVEGWHCIQYSEDRIAYISADYSSVYIITSVAEPVS